MPDNQNKCINEYKNAILYDPEDYISLIELGQF
jgi:hypothetical protein